MNVVIPAGGCAHACVSVASGFRGIVAEGCSLAAPAAGVVGLMVVYVFLGSLAAAARAVASTADPFGIDTVVHNAGLILKVELKGVGESRASVTSFVPNSRPDSVADYQLAVAAC